MTDRNGSVHTLTYDVLGRVTIDAVTTLGSGVDGSVRRIETAYDGQGNAYLVTSYDAASSGNVDLLLARLLALNLIRAATGSPGDERDASSVSSRALAGEDAPDHVRVDGASSAHEARASAALPVASRRERCCK